MCRAREAHTPDVARLPSEAPAPSRNSEVELAVEEQHGPGIGASRGRNRSPMSARNALEPPREWNPPAMIGSAMAGG